MGVFVQIGSFNDWGTMSLFSSYISCVSFSFGALSVFELGTLVLFFLFLEVFPPRACVFAFSALKTKVIHGMCGIDRRKSLGNIDNVHDFCWKSSFQGYLIIGTNTKEKHF